MGPVVWVVLSEMFPTRIRGTAMSIATVSLWIACFLVSQTFPRMLEQLQGRAFFVYGVMCAASFVFVAICLFETKGKTVEQSEKWWEPRDA